MPEKEVKSFDKPIKGLAELKIDLKEQGWMIDEILAYIDYLITFNGKVKEWNGDEEIETWDDIQIHALCLALDANGKYTREDAIAELSIYYYEAESTIGPNISRGLFKACIIANKHKIEKLKKLLYKSYFKWQKIPILFEKLGYCDKTRSYTLDTQALNIAKELFKNLPKEQQEEGIKLLEQAFKEKYNQKNI